MYTPIDKNTILIRDSMGDIEYPAVTLVKQTITFTFNYTLINFIS